MASSSSSSAPLKLIIISILLLSFTLFLLLFPPKPLSNIPSKSRLLLESSSPPPPPSDAPCSAVRLLPAHRRCAAALARCRGDSTGLLNYDAVHFCLLAGDPRISLPVLSLLLLLHFYFLVSAARDHFTPVVTRLAAHLRLSPSMAAVTLLALGNGSPDVFASVAAVRGGHPRTGLGAILSAGAFVSAFVVGAIAVLAAPFPLNPGPFVRDVFFYLIAASALFYVYLSAEIFLWQAVGFILFYLFFVGFVFWMDLVVEGRSVKEGEVEMGLVAEEEAPQKPSKQLDWESGEVMRDLKDAKARSAWSLYGMLGKISQVWEVPIATLLKLTIPSTSPSEWNRFYIAANIGLCPLILLYSLSSFIALDRQIVFLLPQTRFPLWSVVLFVSLCLAVVHFIFDKEPPANEQIAATLIAFMMSVFWISMMAGELLNCLAAIGTIMELPPAILGLTVLAWGNSVGDLVADVALAKAGQPAMAMAGCFAGPMFNMLVGLGAALVIETASTYPGPYELQFHVGIVVAFVFLLLSLMGSLLVVTWYRFRVPRFWGFFLVGLYLFFTAVSLAIARFSR
ncbi:cation/calcium exchanger 5 [Cocos nucifera]|uniref:Cation/calcium exchanger 5 n=1 Tax=Cocos nucifera TaxID=13894 RepID=A0A8K0N9Y1_COCNU|nr:cation/calcium exchanger 5 [Cocos nucifera]